MSNLGRYQEFSTAAKAAGGVDALLKSIERAAVAKAAVPLVLGGMAIHWGVAKMQARAQRAKAALREVEES